MKINILQINSLIFRSHIVYRIPSLAAAQTPRCRTGRISAAFLVALSSLRSPGARIVRHGPGRRQAGLFNS